MKKNSKKSKFKVGDKVVVNAEGIEYDKSVYDDISVEFYNNMVYGVISERIDETSDFYALSFYNHKGICIRKKWYVYKKYVVLYELQ